MYIIDFSIFWYSYTVWNSTIEGTFVLFCKTRNKRYNLLFFLTVLKTVNAVCYCFAQSWCFTSIETKHDKMHQILILRNYFLLSWSFLEAGNSWAELKKNLLKNVGYKKFRYSRCIVKPTCLITKTTMSYS